MAITNGNVELYSGSDDLSANVHTATFNLGATIVPDTDWADTTAIMQAGLRTGNFTSELRYTTGASGMDTVLHAKFKATTTIVPVSLCFGTAEGNAAFTQQVLHTNFATATGGSIGDQHRIGFGGTSGGERITGRQLNNGSQAATGNSTGLDLGTLDAGFRLFSILHVLSGSGTLDVTVDSDDDGGTFGTPTTRITHTQATGATSEVLTLDGAVASDDWWRSDWTIATGPFDFVHIVGIMEI